MPEPRSSESPKPPSWSEWKAQSGSKLWCWRAPLAVEWALDRFVYRLRGLALFDLLELAGKLTILLAVIFWFLEADDRAKERHYRAWELINSANGSTGDGGRKDALQDLNRDGVSLAAAPLESANLAGIKLENGDLSGVNLKGADLTGANFRGASIGRKTITTYKVKWIEVCGLGICVPVEREFKYSSSLARKANLSNAILINANFQNADLSDADLQGADFMNVNLQGANLQEARNLTPEQLDSARGDHQTLLSNGRVTRPAQGNEEPAAQPDAAMRGPAPSSAPGSDR